MFLKISQQNPKDEAAASGRVLPLCGLFFTLALVSMFFPPTVAASDSTPITYAVQAGLYVGPIQSNRMAENLTQAGYSAWVEERQQGNGKFLYFVLVGPFTEEKQALESMRAIHRQFGVSPFVVKIINP
jgi:cell division septation protein DedD